MYLLSLPQELLLQIVEHLEELGDKKSLCNVAATCRRLHNIAEAYLYSSTLFLTRKSFCRFLDATDLNTRRQEYVQDLHLMFSTREYEHGGGVDRPNLSVFKNLRIFESESPECQPWVERKTIQWKNDMNSYMNSFEEASLLSQLPDLEKPLQNLKHMTLQWSGAHGTRYWDISPACPIFLLPQLQSLQISCARIGQYISGPVGSWDEGWLREHSRKTRLTSLVLIECTVSVEALDALLSLPAALKRLTLNETFYHEPVLADRFATSNSELFNRAIVQQRDTLEHLEIMACATYASSPGRINRPLSLSLGDFRALTHLQLGPFVTAPRDNWYQPNLCVLNGPAPPALTYLRLNRFSQTLLRRCAVEDVLSELLIDDLMLNSAARPGSTPLQVDVVFPNLSQGPLVLKLIENFAESFRKRQPHDRSRPPQDQEMRPPSSETERGSISSSNPSFRLDSSSDSEGGVPPSVNAATDAVDQTSEPRLRMLTSEVVNVIPPYLYTERLPRFVARYDSWHPKRFVPEADHTSTDSNDGVIGSEGTESSGGFYHGWL